jgi:hypothetical protein
MELNLINILLCVGLPEHGGEADGGGPEGERGQGGGGRP